MQQGCRDLPLQPLADHHRPLTTVALVSAKAETNEWLPDRVQPTLLWLSQWNREGPRARSRVRVEWGEEGFASVPDHAFVVDAEGGGGEDANG